MKPAYQKKQSALRAIVQNLIPVLLFASVFLVVQSCGSSEAMQLRSAYPQSPVVPGLSVVRGTAGDARIEMGLAGSVADTSSFRFVQNVKSIILVVIHPERGWLDTLKPQLAAMSQPASNGITELVLNAQDRWVNARAIEYDSLYIETLITLQDGKRYGDMQKFILPPVGAKQEPIPTITLTGSVEERTDTSALFVAMAERHRIIPNEYFPSGERLRVTILDGSVIVWSSEQGQFYTQALSPVEPKFVDQVKRYEMQWNGKNQRGEPLPPGRYTVQLMLPVKPHPYSSTMEFSWKVDSER
jgi:hypothetical protein